MPIDVECLVCGGKEFYNESGHYYCNECQTQTQEIQEHVFQNDFVPKAQKNKPVSKSSNVDQTEKKLTSWECWNIIILSLTKELISLGADPQLKRTVKCLWMGYLEKVQVINLKKNVVPKLQIVNSKKDSEILYGRKRKSRCSSRKSSSSESAATTPNTSSLKRQRTKKKKALAQSHYDNLSSNLVSSSLHEETLLSLKSTSEAGSSSKRSASAKYNTYALRELRQFQRKGRLKKRDLRDDDLGSSRPLRYRELSKDYLWGPHIISHNKIYSILYLALLINGDRIQLGDMMRFIREGHMNFSLFVHMFPEELARKNCSSLKNSKHFMISNFQFRKTTATLAHFLGITRYIQIQNISALCYRYCQELNLPDEVYECVAKIIAISKPKMKFSAKSTFIPNYEGRALSFIVFAMKLLFAMDGVTEFEFSKYANLVNRALDERKMFDVVEWLKYIEYRRLVINEHHFPTQYLNDPLNINSDLYVQFITSNNINFEGNSQHKIRGEFKDLLNNLKEKQHEVKLPVVFPKTLTPFLDYTSILSKSHVIENKHYLEDLLMLKCSDDSLDFLLRPNKYLQLVAQSNEKVNVVNGGANTNWLVGDVTNMQKTKMIYTLQKKKLLIVYNTDCDNYLHEALRPPSKTEKKVDGTLFLNNYQQAKRSVFKANRRAVEEISNKVNLDVDAIKEKNGEYYNKHFNPYERYWMNLHMNLNCGVQVDCKRAYSEYPPTFRLFFDDCLRIVEQNVVDLLCEFQLAEIYLVYVEKFFTTGTDTVLPVRLKMFVRQAKNNW